VPLILPGLPAEHTDAIMAEVRSERFGVPVPSYDRTAPDFYTLRYWRGPVVVNVNWLLRRGMQLHGFHDEAEELRTAMLRLVHRSGLYEYFHPRSGQGVGAPAFR